MFTPFPAREERERRATVGVERIPRLARASWDGHEAGEPTTAPGCRQVPPSSCCLFDSASCLTSVQHATRLPATHQVAISQIAYKPSAPSAGEQHQQQGGRSGDDLHVQILRVAVAAP